MNVVSTAGEWTRRPGKTIIRAAAASGVGRQRRQPPCTKCARPAPPFKRRETLPTSPAEQGAQQRARTQRGGARRRAHAHPRMPSTAGYMFVAGSLSLILFWIIWVLLRSENDEAPWIPAGVPAGGVGPPLRRPRAGGGGGGA